LAGRAPACSPLRAASSPAGPAQADPCPRPLQAPSPRPWPASQIQRDAAPEMMLRTFSSREGTANAIVGESAFVRSMFKLHRSMAIPWPVHHPLAEIGLSKRIDQETTTSNYNLCSQLHAQSHYNQILSNQTPPKFLLKKL
jgi:hypothetical protein